MQRNPNDLSGCTSQRKQAGCHLDVTFLHELFPYPRGCCQPLLAILKYNKFPIFGQHVWSGIKEVGGNVFAISYKFLVFFFFFFLRRLDRCFRKIHNFVRQIWFYLVLSIYKAEKIFYQRQCVSVIIFTLVEDTFSASLDTRAILVKLAHSHVFKWFLILSL